MATRSDVLRLDIDVRNQRANRELDKFARKSEQSAKKSERALGGVTSSVNKLRNALYLGGAGALAVGGIRALDALADRADRISAVSQAFDVLTTRIGVNAQAMIQDLRPASQGLVSDMELMRQTNNAILLGLPITTDSMSELTDAAVKLGRAVGLDATRAIESMITGIGRQSRLMLDNLGIVVDTEKAYRDYATRLGIATSELSDQQRKLAFYTATLEAARQKTQGLSPQVDTLSAMFRRLAVDIGNATTNLIDFVNTLPERIAIQRFRRAQEFGAVLNVEPFDTSGLDAIMGRRAQLFEVATNLLTSGFQRRNVPGAQLSPLGGVPGLSPSSFFGGMSPQEFASAFEPVKFALDSVLEPMSPINQEMERFIGNTNAQLEANRELAISLETTAAKYDVMRGALSAAAQSFLVMAQTGQFSAKTLVNAVAQQVFGVLSALAIENVVRGFQEKALGHAALARYDAYAAGQHFEASRGHFATAAKAGAGAGAALGVVGFTSSGSGASGSPVGGNFAGTGFGAPLGAGNAQRPIEITIIVEGSGGSEETAREVARQVERQMRRAGARG